MLKNPGWRVHLLSARSVVDYLTVDFARDVFALQLPPQKLANLIRLHLISRHGGVWADADCYCAQPLDDWLPQNLQGGFFAFRFPADAWLEENRDRRLARLFGRSPDRVLSNWFLAGRSGNPVSATFLEHHLALFKAAGFKERSRRRIVLRLVTRFLRRNAYLASKLSNLRLLRLAGGFPYFIFHYHFAALLLKDHAFNEAWRAVPSVLNGGTLAYGKTLHLAADDRFRRDMSSLGSAPVYKLHWNRTEKADIAGSRYRALIEMCDSSPAAEKEAAPSSGSLRLDWPA